MIQHTLQNTLKKKIIISGSRSFNKSGASKVLSFLLKDRNAIFFFKKSFIPELHGSRTFTFKLFQPPLD